MEESFDRAREELGISGWSCFLDPTFNEDWHDDVVCTNGSERHRPHLREWDSFVEEWELLQSAEEYGQHLNSRD
ncbi:hypothetical protein [Microbacterium sp. zg.Y1084]|uniref:hypothetical protein n=1 Tax=Microbacterium sp. zg.Y1084 TaxID=2969667 RepID=UPI00214C011A|nr:hypothetical protein [Microbacterium sp. zg.Y1084]MCR2813047.1 hypothetical protein [Microbacterium sp. zg.Y1084]